MLLYDLKRGNLHRSLLSHHEKLKKYFFLIVIHFFSLHGTRVYTQISSLSALVFHALS